MTRITRSVALAGLLLPAVAIADTVRLRSGDVLEGDVKDLGDRIEVAAKDGPVSLRWRDVEVVLHDKTALDLCRERRASIAKDDAKDLYALALWAERAGLPEQRRECLEATLKADPENAGDRKSTRLNSSHG